LTTVTTTAANALAYIAKELADGFTGEITIHCNSGGVAKVVVKQAFTTEQLQRG